MEIQWVEDSMQPPFSAASLKCAVSFPWLTANFLATTCLRLTMSFLITWLLYDYSDSTVIHTLLCYEVINSVIIVTFNFFYQVACYFWWPVFRTSERIGKVLQAFTNERNEKMVGENLGKYFMCECMGRLKGNPISFVCFVKSKSKTDYRNPEN